MGCQNLEELHINHNPMENNIEDGAFNGLSKLRLLGLNDNNIGTINDDFFSFNYKLEKVFLSNNQLKSLSQNTFAKLTNLKELYLINNKCVDKIKIGCR